MAAVGHCCGKEWATARRRQKAYSLEKKTDFDPSMAYFQSKKVRLLVISKRMTAGGS
jgi:hypothetical protein